ncbi:hypothetical protein JCM6882_006349 [Rhodosporidiobolus microsporus]
MSESATPTIDWSDPAVTSFLADILGTAEATATALAPSVSRAVQSMVLQNAANNEDSMEDPLLKALPDFTYAMPVQLAILGVTVTLLGMLLVHLLFTIRYHAPLSKVNYFLQTSATVLSLANIASQLHIVMDQLISTGRVWPFMFDYIEISIPKKSWSEGKKSAWLLLQGLNALATHSTHIQFLTMLFPSSLEVKLILGLLGPLALATAGLYFTALSPHAAVNDLGDAIRNTANSSLTLLYTFALFIWGLTLNRSRAWRTDGGTAAFGILALILGVLGTAVNFVEIREERMRWLPGVVTCILLWQSWVGFWWWVGAGMWAGEAEDVERKREKKRRKEEQRRRKREGKQRVLSVTVTGEVVDGDGGETSGARSAVGSLRRRLTSSRPTTADLQRAAPNGEAIEMRDFAVVAAEAGPSSRPAGGDGEEPPAAAAGGSSLRPPAAPRRRLSSGSGGGGDNSGGSSNNGSDTNSSTISSSRPSSHHFYSPLTALFRPFFTQLRTAHDAAAVAQAAKPPGLPDDVRRGWGIKALQMKGLKERGERRQAARGRVAEGAEMDRGERRAAFELEGGERLEQEEEAEEEEADDDDWVDADDQSSGSSDTEEARARRRSRRRERRERLAQARGEQPPASAAAVAASSFPPRPAAAPVETGDEPETPWRARGAEGQQIWWWRGFVGRWRLKDVSQW